jgi:hypothetical protein
MNSSIFCSKPSDNDQKFFCLKGQEDFLDENGNPRISDSKSTRILAKITNTKKSKDITAKNYQTYMIMFEANNKPYNPINSEIQNNYKFVNSVCKQTSFFKEVNQEVFNKYVKFLNTHSLSWLKEIERDLL